MDTESMVNEYKRLIVDRLPEANQYLLLYILDILHIISRNADKNKMTVEGELFPPSLLTSGF
jgi:RhoGAP domain